MNLNRYLDHAVLIPELTAQEADNAIRLGIEFKVRTVCVRPCDIEKAKDLCAGTETALCTVLGFPHGCGSSPARVCEADLYARLGVEEVDMVANYGWLRSGETRAFAEDIRGVHEVLNAAGIPLKVILETGVLDLALVREATEICAAIGVAYVKTSTGFNGGGATVEAVAAMLETAAGRLKVKASGGIRDEDRARMFLDLGCDRLGVNFSSTPAICNGQASSHGDSPGY